MNFREQILAALETKFAGVERSILSRMADKLAKTVTSAEQVATTVEGVTFQQLLQSYGDHRANEAQQSAVKNYESKYNLKDGVAVITSPQQNALPAEAQTGGAATDTTSALLQQLIDQNKKLSERLDRMDGERTTAARKQQLSQIFDKLPASLRKGYERISLDNLSEEEFGKLVTEVSSEVDGIVNETNAKGAVFGKPTAQNSANDQNVLSEAQKAAISRRGNAAVGEGQPF